MGTLRKSKEMGCKEKRMMGEAKESGRPGREGAV